MKKRRGQRRGAPRADAFLPRFLGLRRRPWQVYLFDLDNTLYDANVHCFPQMHRYMHAYLEERLGLDRAAAELVRQRYWRRYGTTLAGLMRHHDTDPQEFLRAIHPPALAASVPANPRLDRWLASLDGPAYIFTNSVAAHAERVLERLQVRQHFLGIFDLPAADLRGKPDAQAYRRLLRLYGVPACHCHFFDDSRANLHTARLLGMRTTWVHPRQRRREQWAQLPPHRE
ncbi:pyrimidine 5'-nucleotidase [Acidithiobacillus sp. IBUN Pt1247-S3]|uniref:pyrimidine 5'-nucleotidase n=1 Tax=Acidithiobacillus sp. IBUN Pt1247-S3 TaxID=3166642 RepID=UPI0034E48F27